MCVGVFERERVREKMCLKLQETQSEKTCVFVLVCVQKGAYLKLVNGERERLLESIEQTENNLDEMRKGDKNGGLKMSLPGTEEATPPILHRTRNLGFKN